MIQACCRMGRLLMLVVGVALSAGLSWGAAPATTRISDVVYRADGTPASGTLLITWPAFTTADNSPVAAGTKSVTLGAQGALTVDLVPNAGSNPANTLYRVVYKLDDGTTSTEYWNVGTASPTTIASVRTTLGNSGASQIVSRQYVDSVVANKANDVAVVHKSGTEIIEGNKQFSAPPAVPTPLLASDAANKAYVDGAVAAVGSGSYVSKSGDLMTGPLTLPGDPTAPNHAATRHYVDAGLGAKADLASGTVPTSELATGAPDATKCLKGDGTWGACGTSSNAISIQGIPIDTTAPTDGQVQTYEAASGMYKPKTGGGALSAGMQAVKYASDFTWTFSAATDLSTPGSKTVTLSSCPTGVKGNEPEYWVYVSGTGTPEAAKVTGGTCAGNGISGTLQFTTINAHAAGYTISSASAGLQEASIAARVTPTNPAGTSQAGRIIAPPGEFAVRARVSFRASNQTIDFSGSFIDCWVDDSCLFVGDPSNSNSFNNITLINPRGRPTVANGTKPFIEVNAQKTRLFNVMARLPYSGGTFGTLVQVDDDQAFLLDGLDTVIGTSNAIRCDTTFCGAVVTAPGPFNTWSAVGWLKNLNISNQCNGNGVDWQSGNTLHISDSVIQGYSQFGIRSGTARGGYSSNTTLTNIYMETGSCTNKIAGLGIAGVIQQGAHLLWENGTGPQGVMPKFANTGSTRYLYFVVARHATYGPSAPIYVGDADTNGAGNITVTAPDIAGAASFDLLRITRNSNPPYTQTPNGTGNWAVVTGVTRASACSGGTGGNPAVMMGGVCTFTDTQAPLTSYTVTSPPTYFPELSFWNGDIVLGAKTDSSNGMDVAATATFLGNDLQGNGVFISVLGALAPALLTDYCSWKVDWDGKWVSCMTANSHSFIWGDPHDATNLQNLKGRANFGAPKAVPSHVVTLSDSNFAKTIAQANNRPNNDANDAYIGYDHKAGGLDTLGISFGAPYSISHYIGNVGDDTNWKERLTASLKSFRVPVDFGSNALQGSEMTTPSNPSTGTQKGYFKAGSGFCALDSSGTERCTGSGSGGSSPLTTKGDLFTFSTTNTRLPAGANGLCLQADSTQATGLKWGNCGTGGSGETDTYTPSSGTKTISGNLHTTGNAQVDGQLSVAGPWQMVSDVPANTMSATASKTTMGVDSDGKVKVSENGGAVTELAKKGGIDGSDIATGTVSAARLPDLSPTYPNAGSCTNQVVTALNNGAAPTCTTLTDSYVASANKQGNATKFGMATGSFTSGNYRSSDSNGNQVDSGVKAGPYSMWLTVPRAGSSGTSGAQPANTANKAMLWGVVLPFPLATTKVTYIVQQADNTANTYDLGIYDTSGNLVAHIGSIAGTTFAPSLGARTLNWSASATLQPGKYYLALTSSCTSSCAILNADNGSGFTFQQPSSTGNLSIATGGLLPSTATMPADTWGGAAYIPALAIWQ